MPFDPQISSDRVDITDDLGARIATFTGTLSGGQGTVTWPKGTTVDVTRKYSAQVYAVKDGIQLLTFPVSLSFTGCGDIRDQIIKEYNDNKIVDRVTGQLYVPACTDFTQDKHSTNFQFAELNTSTYNTNPNSWAILRDILFTGLEAIRHLNGDQTLGISSGYRNPVLNINTPNSDKLKSRHMFGDAVDIRTGSDPIAWQTLHDFAVGADINGCVEPHAISTYDHLHVEWPGQASLTDARHCQVGWAQ